MAFTTPKQCHIALDERLQLLNSNRKISVHPEQYDNVLNDAIEEFINTHSTPKLNSRQEGFEESDKRYVDLQSLKRTVTLSLRKYSSTISKAQLPFDFMKSDVLIGTIIYNRKVLAKMTSYRPTYYTIINFSTMSSIANLKLGTTNGTQIDVSKYSNLTKSSNSLFYFFNNIGNYLKRSFNIEVFFEHYNGVHYPNCLIFKSQTSALQINSVSVSNLTLTVSTESETYEMCANKNASESKFVKFDLVSSKTFANVHNDFYSQRNSHLNPMFIIRDNQIEVRNSTNYVIESLELDYLKKPILINSSIGQMTDFEVTSEVIDIAAKNLALITKDDTYQQMAQKGQLNN